MQRRRSRREFLLASVAGAGLAAVPSAFGAAARALTPRQTAGPFYPLELPLDSDNDLIQVAGRGQRAAGVPINLIGHVYDAAGRPIGGARVEIWQCDAHGRYHHPYDDRGAPRDDNFQGFGATLSGPDGAYRFRTIKPVPYPGRTPHIHVRVRDGGTEVLTTQMYLAGEAGNARDGLYRRLGPEEAAALTVSLEPNPDDSAALLARFDIRVAAGGRLDHG